MGDLTKMNSRVTSTLEVLDRLNVSPEDWDEVRRNELRAKSVAAAFKGRLTLETTVLLVEPLTVGVPALPRSSESLIHKFCKEFRLGWIKDNSPESAMTLTFAKRLAREDYYRDPDETTLEVVGAKPGLSQAIWLVEKQKKLPSLMSINFPGKTYILLNATISLITLSDPVHGTEEFEHPLQLLRYHDKPWELYW